MRALPLAALILVFCIRSPAALIPGPNLAKRIESAQIIVVGKLVTGTTLTRGDLVSSDFVLHVDRVLKGELIPGSEIGAHLEGRGYFMAPNANQTSISEKIYGIWFLNPAAHSYTVISRDGTYGELFAAPVMLSEDAPPGKPGDTPAASVLNELVAVLRWLAGTHGDRLNTLAERAAGEERKTDSLSMNLFRSLAENLHTLDVSLTHPSYREFASDKSAALRTLGIQGLIEANDPQGVKYVAVDWDDLAAHADVNPVINSLMGFSNGSDGVAVRALGSLALRHSIAPALRETASYALRAIHTKDAAPALVALLAFQEERIRINALSGLCLFVRNAPTVTPEAVASLSWMQSRQPAPLLNDQTQNYCFMGGIPGHVRDLQRYVDFWTSWWNQHRMEIEEN